MSARDAATPEALLFDPAISMQAKCVYAVLSRKGRTPEKCFPSYEWIAERLGSAERSVPAWIAELAAAGWIEVHHRRTPGGRQSSNGYTLHDEASAPVQRAPSAPVQRAPSAPVQRAPERA